MHLFVKEKTFTLTPNAHGCIEYGIYQWRVNLESSWTSFTTGSVCVCFDRRSHADIHNLKNALMNAICNGIQELVFACQQWGWPHHLYWLHGCLLQQLQPAEQWPNTSTKHPSLATYQMTSCTLTFLLAMMTIGTVSSSSFSRTILARSCLRLYQLEMELTANRARKPSPFARDVSRNSKNSSCPAVSMISTSWWSKPYSIWVM